MINDAEASSYKGMKVEGGKDLLLNGRQYSLDDPNADTCEYKDYVIDYEVSFDKAIAAGEVVLLGNYGPFGWTPIPSIAIAANTPIRLLANSGEIYGTQFTMTYSIFSGFFGESLTYVGNPAPPMPTMPASLTQRMISSFVRFSKSGG